MGVIVVLSDRCLYIVNQNSPDCKVCCGVETREVTNVNMLGRESSELTQVLVSIPRPLLRLLPNL